MPGVYRVFHFGQTASRENNTPMAGTTVQPSHKPPHKRKKLSGKKEPQEGVGGKENWLEKTSWRNNAAGRKLHASLNQLGVW